jgi:hypothetical protein
MDVKFLTFINVCFPIERQAPLDGSAVQKRMKFFFIESNFFDIKDDKKKFMEVNLNSTADCLGCYDNE